MCIIFTSNGQEINLEYLKKGYENNGHGIGFAVAKDGDLILEKGFFDFDEFYNKYQQYLNLPIVIHFRWATIGARNKENCHPFMFLNGENELGIKAVVAHNGHINGHTEIAGMSDTFNFVKKRLIPLAEDYKNTKYWTNTGFKWVLQEAIGVGNKLVFLDNSGHIEIYNERIGEWVVKDEIWASNDLYRTKKYRAEKNGREWQEDDFAMFRTEQKRKQELETKSKIINGFGGEHQIEDDNSDVIESEDVGQHSSLNDVNREDLSFDDDIQKKWDVSNEELKEIDDYLEELNN